MQAERFVSYAQNFEDVMLWRALRDVVSGPGFYIDVGASDPTVLSVTRAFYDRGWRGLNIEPLPEAAAALVAARPRDVTVEAAAGAAPGRHLFHRVVQDGQTGLSTLDPAEARLHAAAGARVESFEVEVQTLADLARRHVPGPVHFLKVDAEGAEVQVFAGADFAVCRPWIVVVEATRPASEDQAESEWEPGLLEAGYRAVWFDGLNRFYLAIEHGHLARHFRLPANVFDNYVQYDAVLRGHAADLSAESDRRGAAILHLRAEIARLEAELAARPPAPSLCPPPQEAPKTPPEAPHETPPEAPSVRPASGGWLHRLLRPAARRTRAFLLGEVDTHLTELRAQQVEVLQRLDAIRPTDPRGPQKP